MRLPTVGLKVLAIAASAAGVLGFAQAAHASRTHRCFKNWGYLPAARGGAKVKVVENACIRRVGTRDRTHGLYRGEVTTTFVGAVAPVGKWEVRSGIQLDRRRGRDVTVKPEALCDITSAINGHSENVLRGVPPRRFRLPCQINKIPLRSGGGRRYSMDGEVKYDIRGDGAGARKWSLIGSPTVR